MAASEALDFELIVDVSIGCGTNLRDDFVVVSTGSTLNFLTGGGDDILVQG